jgi:hypothetical protein
MRVRKVIHRDRIVPVFGIPSTSDGGSGPLSAGDRNPRAADERPSLGCLCGEERSRRSAETIRADRMITPVAVSLALRALFFDVGQFAARRQLAVSADHAATGERPKSQEPHETHDRSSGPVHSKPRTAELVTSERVNEDWVSERIGKRLGNWSRLTKRWERGLVYQSTT